MKILITGAAGYLCQEAIAQLSLAGHTLRLSDIIPYETEHEFCKCDVLSPEDVYAAVDGVDAVFHTVLGGLRGQPRSPLGVVRQASAHFNVTVMGTWNILQAAAQLNVPKVVMIGSEAARGQRIRITEVEVCDEKTPAKPDYVYAVAKYVMEPIAEYSTRIDGVQTAVLRNAWFGSARGKPVVGPSQLKILWNDLADGVTVPQYGQEQCIGPARIYTMSGRQYSRNVLGADGQREGVPGEDPARETESIVYLLRVGDIVFMHGAENHVPTDEWLRQGIAQGWAPNVVLSVGQFQGQRSIDAVLRQRPPVFRIPIHDYEMMHGGGGNRTTPWFTGGGRQAFDQRRAMPLFWGENFHLTREALDAVGTNSSGAAKVPPK